MKTKQIVIIILAACSPQAEPTDTMAEKNTDAEIMADKDDAMMVVDSAMTEKEDDSMMEQKTPMKEEGGTMMKEETSMEKQ